MKADDGPMRWGKVQNCFKCRLGEQFLAAFLDAILLPSPCNRLAGVRPAGTNLCKPTLRPIHHGTAPD
ncbi:hypothetical protein CBM2609_U10071 [Cupriavidus taiwanensis]|nr:hypothetical protein CBM2609_U10071 [Cupriavidus taiwanensis]